MKCSKCGKEVQEEWSFCNYCGNKIDKHNKNRKLNKKIIFIISVLIILMGVFIIRKINEIETLSMTELDYNVVVNKDGSIDVTEIWNLSIPEINTIFKTFSEDSNLENVKVYKILKSGKEEELTQINELMYPVTKNSYYAQNNEDGDFEIAWGVNAKNKLMTYKITYTVKDAVKVYQDYSVLKWFIVGKNNSIPINKLNGKIEYNFSKEKEYGILEYFLYSKSQYDINENDDVISFSVDNINSNSSILAYTITPSEWFNEDNIINEKIRPYIESELFNNIFEFTNQSSEATIETYIINRKNMYSNKISDDLTQKLSNKIIKKYDELLGIKDENSMCTDGIEEVYKDRDGRYVPSQLFGGADCPRHINKHLSISNNGEIKQLRKIRNYFNGELLNVYEQIEKNFQFMNDSNDYLKISGVKFEVSDTEYIFTVKIKNISENNIYNDVYVSADLISETTTNGNNTNWFGLGNANLEKYTVNPGEEIEYKQIINKEKIADVIGICLRGIHYTK